MRADFCLLNHVMIMKENKLFSNNLFSLFSGKNTFRLCGYESTGG